MHVHVDIPGVSDELRGLCPQLERRPLLLRVPGAAAGRDALRSPRWRAQRRHPRWGGDGDAISDGFVCNLPPQLALRSNVGLCHPVIVRGACTCDELDGDWVRRLTCVISLDGSHESDMYLTEWGVLSILRLRGARTGAERRKTTPCFDAPEIVVTEDRSPTHEYLGPEVGSRM